MARSFSAVIFLVPVVFDLASGAYVELKATPSPIVPGLTKFMTLRCAVESDVLPTAAPAIIGRRVAISETSVGYNADIKNVMSILIIRLNNITGVNETVASISTHDSANALLDTDIIQVEGDTDLPSSSREIGYLQLTWDRPLSGQTGLYTCEVSAIDSSLHAQTKFLSLKIETRTPSTEDIAQSLTSMERYVQQLEQEVADLRSEVRNKTSDCQCQNSSVPNTAPISSQAGQNIQTGYIHCATAGVSTYQVVHFDVAFQKVPEITLTLATFQCVSYLYSNVVGPHLFNSKTTEFTLECKPSYNEYTVAWMAYEDTAA